MRDKSSAFLILVLAHLIRMVCGAAQGTSPQFITEPTNQTAYDMVTLGCSAFGSPQPTISWYKDSLAVQLSTARVTLLDAGDIVITALQASDAGAYYCVAQNSLGSVQSLTGHLTLAEITSIPSSTLQTVSVIDFDHISLACLNFDLPSYLQISWTSLTPGHIPNDRVGVSLATGELWFANFNSLSGDGNTVYTCSVSNSITGSTQPMAAQYRLQRSGSGALFREVAIPVGPVSVQTIAAGETVNLECLPTGRPAPVMTWLKDGTQISPSGRVLISANGWSLTLSDVNSADSGEYTCRAVQTTNTGPITRTSSGTLIIVDPPQITSSFPETAANLTQPLTLSCSADGTDPLDWTWRVNTEPVTMTTTGLTVTDGVLSISDVSEENGGVYQCVVCQHLIGRCHSANQLITPVSFGPVFTARPDAVLVFVGASVTLPCAAEGFPPPTFSWYRHLSPTPISITGRYSVSSLPNNGSLTILPAQRGDTSQFLCRASNVGGPIDTPSRQLTVIDVPMVTASPPGSLTPAQGTLVTLECSILSDSAETVTYQWLLEESPFTQPSSSGSLTISDFQSSNNGVYECVAMLRVAGVGDIQYTVGSSVITVGGPPVAPTPPLNPRHTTLTATSFTAVWDTPTFDGGLPLRNYSIEILDRGNTFCPGNFIWSVAVSEVEPTATVAMVTGLVPSYDYQFRVFASNYEHRSTSSSVVELATLGSAPLTPPTNLRATTDRDEGTITATWGPPTPCTAYGGPLTAYTLEYKVQSEGVWSTINVGDEVTQYTLSDLRTSTYDLRVAAHTSVGRGVWSAVTMVTVQVPLLPPTGSSGQSINSTSVSLSWDASPGATGYIVTYVHPDHTLGRVEIGPITSLVVTGLFPGNEYMFSLSCLVGIDESPPTVIIIVLPQGLTTARPVYEEIWFIAAVAVGTVVLISGLMITLTCLCFKCCWKCGSDKGKIYITSRRSASSLSGGSSGFSEYQHRQKINALNKSIKVHTSPTPSRRPTDYTDMNSLRPAHSLTAPSLTYTDSAHNDGHYPPRAQMTPDGAQMSANGLHNSFIDDPDDPTHMYPPDEPDYPISDLGSTNGEFLGQRVEFRGHSNFDLPEKHVRHFSGGVSQQFFDTLNRVHTPPPLSSQSPDCYTPQTPTPQSYGLSQETNDSWTPADHLNTRGHMTNNPVSRSSSNRSSHTSASVATPQKVDLGGRKRNGPLSPVREQLFQSHEHHMMNGMSLQEFPPRSNSVHGHQSRSTGHIQAQNERPDSMRSRSHSAANTHNIRQPPVGMELGTMTANEIQSRQLPQIPFRQLDDTQSSSSIDDPHTVEYSSIPHVMNRNKGPVNHYPPPTSSAVTPGNHLPPPPEFRHSPEYIQEPLVSNQPVYNQPSNRHHSNPARINYPPIEIRSPSQIQTDAHHMTSSPHHMTGSQHHMTSSPHHVMRSPSPVYSAPVVKPKPTARRNLQLQNGPPNMDNGTVPAHGKFERIPMNQIKPNQQQQQLASTHMPQALPNHALLPLQHPTENSGSSHSFDGTVSSEGWPLDDLQRQFETDIQDLEALQNMLTPAATDTHLSFEAFQDQVQVVNMNDGGPVFVNNQQMSRNQSAPGVQSRLVAPPVAPKSQAKSATDIRINPPPLMTMDSRQDSSGDSSLALNKQRPNVPDLKQLDPRKPKKLQGKVRGTVWQPRSMNRVIESSSDSECDSDSDFSIADTVVEADDNISLKSSHV